MKRSAAHSPVTRTSCQSSRGLLISICLANLSMSQCPCPRTCKGSNGLSSFRLCACKVRLPITWAAFADALQPLDKAGVAGMQEHKQGAPNFLCLAMPVRQLMEPTAQTWTSSPCTSEQSPKLAAAESGRGWPGVARLLAVCLLSCLLDLLACLLAYVLDNPLLLCSIASVEPQHARPDPFYKARESIRGFGRVMVSSFDAHILETSEIGLWRFWSLARLLLNGNRWSDQVSGLGFLDVPTCASAMSVQISTSMRLAAGSSFLRDNPAADAVRLLAPGQTETLKWCLLEQSGRFALGIRLSAGRKLVQGCQDVGALPQMSNFR